MAYSFREYIVQRELNEVARSSLWHNLSKWGAGGQITKPVALLTAFVEEPRDAEGEVPVDPLQKRRLNRGRNEALKRELAHLGMSHYSVIGAGQSQRRFVGFPYISPSAEESFVVQSRGEMQEEDFLDALQQLLVQYNQYAAAVKIPSNPMAFLFLQNGERILLGISAETRRPGEPYYTALTKGPRADDGMLDSWELHGERNPFRRMINWFHGRSDMNRPRQQRGGRRFVIKNPEPIPRRGASDVQGL
ncbi:MAG: hypothetical protein ACRELG_06150 [Gemmataceae bacterium]